MNLLTEFRQYLLSSKNKVSKTTVKNYSADVRRFVLWLEDEFTKTFNISDVTPQVIDIYKKTSSQEQKTTKYKKLSARSLERHLSSLNHFFKFLKQQNIIPKNPFEEIKLSLKKNVPQSQWFLPEFKNYLYVDRAAPLTIKNYIVDINQFFTWLRAEKDPLAKINPMLVSEYKYYLLTPNSLRGMGLTLTTVNRKLSSLRKYFAWAQKQNLIDTSPLTILNEKIIPLNQTYFNNKDATSQEPEGLQSEVLKYSHFPPKRLLQKTLQAIIFLLDNTLTMPLAKLVEQLKPKKAICYLNRKRPKWYKKHHLHFAILVILMSVISVATYNKFFPQAPSTDVLSANIANIDSASTRILSLKGRLTDSFDNSITSKDTPLRVTIYSDGLATGSALLWQEVILVNPDKDGLFETVIGENTPLPQNIFLLHPRLWLGVSVGRESELVPRQEIATSSYAENSESLQGLLPITQSDAGTKNVVLALDSSGNLTIGKDASPIFQAVGGQFTLSGKVLLLSTVTGSNANVMINPDGLGKIDLQKPLQNTSGALEVNDLFTILATSSGQSAFTINQDSTGPIISASSSGTAKFTVENNGNIVSAPGASWQPTFDAQNSLNIASASGVPFVTFDTLGLNVGIANSAPKKTLDVIGSFRVTGDITFTNFAIEGGILYASASGQITQIAKGESTQCLLGGATPKFGSCLSYNNITESGNNIGIGTTSPISQLHVTRSSSLSPTGKALVIFDQIENQDIFTASSSGTTRFRLTNSGNIAINTTNISNPLTIGTDGTNGNAAYLTSGGIWTNASSQEMKENFIRLDSEDILDKINQLQVLEWNYKLENPNIKHIGPIAEDFYALFGVGNDNKHISSIDPAGVALLGIQALSSKIASGIGDFAEVVVAKLKVGLVKAEEITTNSFIITTDSVTIAEQSLKEYISNTVSNLTIGQLNNRIIVSPVVKADQVQTNIISPLASDSNISISLHDSQFIIHDSNTASGSAVATIDSSGNASFSGTLASTDLDVGKDATVGGTLRAGKIVAESIEGLEARVSTLAADYVRMNQESGIMNQENDSPSIIQNSNISTNSSELAVTNLSSAFATFTHGLMSFGPTSLAETSIAGTLYIEGSLNTLDGDLEFQSLRQGGISFLSGLIYIDKDGNLKVEGNAEFAKDVLINGDLVASGSATFSKLNLNIVQPVFAVSPTQVIATGSAGLAAIKANQKELTIKNRIVTDKSLIYITPVGTPSAQTPFLMRQIHEQSFTVGLQSPIPQDTLFNWLIVN